MTLSILGKETAREAGKTNADLRNPDTWLRGGGEEDGVCKAYRLKSKRFGGPGGGGGCVTSSVIVRCR